jgi:hypothetical protein
VRTGMCLGWMLAGTLLVSSGVEAGGLGRAVAKGVSRSARKALTKTLRRDLLRDRATRLRPLSRSRTVFRYTTKGQARQELRKGIRPERHMTSRALPGRPLSPEGAQRRYGLPKPPQVRETIRLPRGLPVRPNRALGGALGVGEITSSRRLPPEAIRKVTPLK